MKVFYVTFFIVLVDQVSKLLIKGFSIPFLNIYHKGMELNSSLTILEDFLKITYVENPGMAFGLDFGGKLFFSLFTIAASIGISYYIYKVRNDKLILRVPLALILGGAIGNLIDRTFYGVLYNEAPFFHGKVVDFIYLTFVRIDFFGIHLNGWPIFNISDLAVTIGVLMLIVFHKKITSEKEELPATDNTASNTEFTTTQSDINLNSEKGAK